MRLPVKMKFSARKRARGCSVAYFLKPGCENKPNEDESIWVNYTSSTPSTLRLHFSLSSHIKRIFYCPKTKLLLHRYASVYSICLKLEFKRRNTGLHLWICGWYTVSSFHPAGLNLISSARKKNCNRFCSRQWYQFVRKICFA